MLKVSHVTKAFNRELTPDQLKIALNDISVHIADGEFVTVIGGNGSGKSTFLNVICGAHIPDTGEILLDDIDITTAPEHKRAVYLGRVFQDPMMGTAANMSILENLIIAKRKGTKKRLKWGFQKTEEKQFRELVSSLNLGLENRLEQKMGLLSGGQRQAITLIMAILEKPKLLLLDEHTAALDPKTAKVVLELTNKIIEENHLTTIMITHNMKDAIKYGNRLLMFHEGKIIYDARGEEKKNLTIANLLTKFESMDDIEISDEMVLSK